MAQVATQASATEKSQTFCRFCKSELKISFADLGTCPPSNSFLSKENLNVAEAYFPLHAFVCESCFLVQVDEFEKPEQIFNQSYAYFSSFSDSWLKHAEQYCSDMMNRWKLNENSLVIELASNDGYLLQNFKKKGIPVLGVEPSSNVAEAAMAKGIPTLVQFFGEKLAKELKREGKSADLLPANNVLAHVPNLNDFVRGIREVLKPTGVMTIEFPHLLKLIEQNQFDTIYHEHFSYFSLMTVVKVFKEHGIQIFDVEELPTHGGSLRIYGTPLENPCEISERVKKVIADEKKARLDDIKTYETFQRTVREYRLELLQFFLNAKLKNKKVVGYGAAAKGNTLLNYCGIDSEFMDFVVDRSPHKQGLFTPGSRIPVKSPDEIRKVKPDYLFILPWNLENEIVQTMSFIREWGGQFVIPIPKIKIIP